MVFNNQTMSTSIHEERPFLPNDDSESRRDDKGHYSIITARLLIWLSLIGNLSLLLICVLLSGALLYVLRSAQPKSELPEPYSPANNIVEFEYRGVIRNDSRFLGRPTPEWQESMHELMAGTLIRITDEELQLAGADSIPLQDGGYAGGLGVGHNLHCVKQIKQFLYRDHSYPDLELGSERFEYLQTHADHCLDFIRQGIMCHLDYSLYTVYWGERRQDIPTHRDPPVQKCVNWEKLHAWMQKRAADTGMLVGP
ncbi:hypothetical protein QBC40DRAFT_314969 [Triangularia verruculosa]|uniref:Tat pathway signal sequence n=1 Tax=Triangularia verruculosa TaxID=2587418 RepID=A0AAN6X836_9PEZI|nr:hypothetical protein QBC40DRAFT_314969 [Triangularia verruculosa]